MAFYVVSYDIAETKLRNRVAKLLEGYGSRVQYSVFECELDRERYHVLWKHLSEITLDEETNSIRIYPLCGKCEEKSVFLGTQNKGIRNLLKQTIVI